MSSKHHRKRTRAEKAALGASIREAAASMPRQMTAAHLAFVYRTTQAFVRIHAGEYLKPARKVTRTRNESKSNHSQLRSGHKA